MYQTKKSAEYREKSPFYKINRYTAQPRAESRSVGPGSYCLGTESLKAIKKRRRKRRPEGIWKGTGFVTGREPDGRSKSLSGSLDGSLRTRV